MLPEFPRAKKIIGQSQTEFFQFAQKMHLGEPFGSIPKRPLEEGNALKQVYSKDMELETEMKKLEAKFDVGKDELKENPFIVYNKLYDAAKDFAAQQVRAMFETINDVTALTGNVVSPKGEYTINDFFAGMEKVEIDFDAGGNPIFPTIVGGPDVINKIKSVLKQSEQDPKNMERMQQIVALKKQQWNDRENSRKLVD